jgi:hypothetical protein
VTSPTAGRGFLWLVLVFVGVVALASGIFAGCSAVLAWSGRRPLAVYPLTPGTPLSTTFPAKRETRYTVGVQVVFDERGGALEAKMPLVARMVDDGGQVSSNVVGWIDPAEPPTVVFGHADKAPADRRRSNEAVVERAVGPWACARTQTARLDVDLGPDRVGRNEVREARVVLYDDALPAPILAGFGGGAAGAVAMLVGLIGLLRGRRRHGRRISPHAGRKKWQMRPMRSSRPIAVVAALALFTASNAFAQGTGTTAPKKDDKAAAQPKTDKDKKPPAAPATGDSKKAAGEKKSDQETANAEDGEHLKELDSDRAIYVAFDLGLNRTDLGGFSDDLGFDKTGANGGLYGLGAGLRLKHLRFGARFRGISTTEFTIWEAMAEVGYGLGWRPLSPSIWLHAGYLFDTGIERGAIANQLPQGNVLAPDVDINGLVVGTELNFAYYITQFLRVGPFAGFDVLFIDRKQAPLPQSVFPLPPETRQNPLFSDTGSGIGWTVHLGLRGAFDVVF